MVGIEVLLDVMEPVSLILMLSSFIVLTILWAKVRTVRSLQFQLWFFGLVLVISETPRILGTVGLIDLNPYEVLGLEIHTVSMIVFGLFIAYRSYRFLRLQRNRPRIDQLLTTKNQVTESGSKTPSV